jgi:hypothetical protein
MILVDKIGHLVSDTSWEELHEFALKIGLKREWFQDKGKFSHYDLTTPRKRGQAVLMGAKFVRPYEIVKALNKLEEGNNNAVSNN